MQPLLTNTILTRPGELCAALTGGLCGDGVRTRFGPSGRAQGDPAARQHRPTARIFTNLTRGGHLCRLPAARYEVRFVRHSNFINSPMAVAVVEPSQALPARAVKIMRKCRANNEDTRKANAGRTGVMQSPVELSVTAGETASICFSEALQQQRPTAPRL
jgi:hypothetical protein